jgi:hypothetical protein
MCLIFPIRTQIDSLYITKNKYNTWRFIIFSVITNVYNKKTKIPTLMELNRIESTAPSPHFPLISLGYAENWPEPFQRHFQRSMGDQLISACIVTQRQKCELRWKTTFWKKNWVVSSICTGFVNTSPTIFIIIRSFYSLWSIGNPWRVSSQHGLQLSPWPHSMTFLALRF